MQDYIRLNIVIGSEEQKELLIAELDSIGFEGFEEEGNVLRAYVEESHFDAEAFNVLVKRYPVEYTTEKIEEKNWNEEWEKNFEPVFIEGFCSVRAEFHPPNADAAIELIITPKMSFGTGHHATTYMMVQLMERLPFVNTTVFDFGTGTGILAILAEKLGAASVTAIDVDEWSIENARENISLNHCTKINLYRSDNIPVDKTFDILLANINRNVILDNMPAMCKLLVNDGQLLLSGLLAEDFEMVHEKALQYRLSLQEMVERNNWITLRYLLKE